MARPGAARLGKARNKGGIEMHQLAIVCEPPHPTDAEVEALTAAAADLEEGGVFGYERMAPLVGAEPRTERWKTVVGRWKRLEFREGNRTWKCVPGRGFELLAPVARIGHAGNLQDHGRRRLRLALAVAARTDADELPAPEQAKRSHMLRIGGALAAIEDAEKKALRRELKALTE
jgi:hypothetical protein